MLVQCLPELCSEAPCNQFFLAFPLQDQLFLVYRVPACYVGFKTFFF